MKKKALEGGEGGGEGGKTVGAGVVTKIIA
jgi:hypothetical protein